MVVDRRRFLKSVTSVAGLSAAGLPAQSVFAQTRTVNHVAVIGAGIVGSSIAYNLARSGCQVTIVEKGLPAARASGTTFGWINAAYANQPPSYQELRRYSLEEYRRISEDVPLPIRWGGSLEWIADDAGQRRMIDEVEAFRKATDAPTSIVDAERAREIEPNLSIADDRRLAWSTDDGAIDSAAATQALFDRAIQYGAEPLLLSEVDRIYSRRRQVRVRTSFKTLEVDLAVVAAGIGTAELAETTDERVDSIEKSTPGIIVTTDPIERVINTVLYGPDIHLHQLADGSVMIGEKAGTPDSETHRLAMAGRPQDFPDDAVASQHAVRLLDRAREIVPALSAVRRAHVRIGWRPMPADGLPIIGHGGKAPNVYFATMHSGVSLAPIVGRLAAEEILDGARFEILEKLRPQRF